MPVLTSFSKVFGTVRSTDRTDSAASDGAGAPPDRRGGSRWGLVVVSATALWALFLAAGELFSGRWWLWTLPDLAPPLLMAAVPLALLPLAPMAGRRGCRWLVPALVLLLLAGLPRAGLHPAALLPGERQAAPADAIRVFSWNTQYWDTSADSEEFYAFLREQRADVYLLQEYLAWTDGGAAPIDAVARLRTEFPDHEVVVRGELVTLSRFPVRAQPALGPGPEPAPEAGWLAEFEWAKVLRTDVEAHGTLVSLYNVHIPVQLDVERSPLTREFYGDIRRSAEERRDQYRVLTRDATANPHPVLISGDFNTTAAMAELDDLRAEFTDAAVAGDRLYPATWHSRALPLWRLDWTFTSDPLYVHRYRLTDPGGLSDHHGQHLLVSVDAPH